MVQQIELPSRASRTTWQETAGILCPLLVHGEHWTSIYLRHVSSSFPCVVRACVPSSWRALQTGCGHLNKMLHIGLLEHCTHQRVLCVCVWVNRNGRRLESVKISGSHSGDCDDCCRWVVTSCKGTAVLEARCCGTWRKVSDAGKGGKGLDCKCISGRILFLYPEDWGSRFLQHIATCLLNYTAFCTRRR